MPAMIAVGLFAFLPGQALAETPAQRDSLAAESTAVVRAAPEVNTNPPPRIDTEYDRAAMDRAAMGDTLTSFPPPRVRAWQVGLVRGDRLEHASLSFAIASATIIATRNRAAGAATALTLGLGKEILDGRRGHFDPVDLAADAVGVMLATVLVAPRGP